jgi:hypothetical protein
MSLIILLLIFVKSNASVWNNIKDRIHDVMAKMPNIQDHWVN